MQKSYLCSAWAGHIYNSETEELLHRFNYPDAYLWEYKLSRPRRVTFDMHV